MFQAYLIHFCVSPEISHFSKELWFTLLGNGDRNQDVGNGCALCHWNVIAYRPSQLTEETYLLYY